MHTVPRLMDPIVTPSIRKTSVLKGESTADHAPVPEAVIGEEGGKYCILSWHDLNEMLK